MLIKSAGSVPGVHGIGPLGMCASCRRAQGLGDLGAEDSLGEILFLTIGLPVGIGLVAWFMSGDRDRKKRQRRQALRARAR